MKPLVNVAAAFLLGALATLWLGNVLLRRRGPGPRSDEHLRKRALAQVARLVSRPDAIHVAAQRGVVRVSGRVLSSELDGLLSQLTRLPGVYKVRNALTALDDPSGFDANRRAAEASAEVDETVVARAHAPQSR